MPEAVKTQEINADTKIGELIAAFPQVEAKFDELVPTFGKLKPGVFRDTIARTTTLERAASASRVRLPDLLIKLRRLAGLDASDSNAANLPGKPLWVSKGRVVKELDARPMLAQGTHPKQIVMDNVSALHSGEVFVLLTPFVPGPLIELARAQGFETWTRQGGSGKVETYFGKN
jgi:hypothetical protein